MSVRLIQNLGSWLDGEVILPHTMPRSLYMKPEILPKAKDQEYWYNHEFWSDVFNEKVRCGRNVTLRNFNMFEWFPRNPGLFHTARAERMRAEAEDSIRCIDEVEYKHYAMATDAPPDHAMLFRSATASGEAARRRIYTPQGKSCMLQGGVGCIRLKSVTFENDGEYWWMSATSSQAPDEGIPIALPNSYYRNIIDEIADKGFAPVDLTGSLEFIPEKYSDAYGAINGLPRLYVKIDNVVRSHSCLEYGLVSVAASFVSEFYGEPGIYASYVTFEPGTAGARRSAANWLKDEYVEGMYDGWILTDYDQQAPAFSSETFSLDHILSSPDLVKTIQRLKTLYGKFDWSLLEKNSFSFTENKGEVVVEIKGSNVSGLAVAKGKDIAQTVHVTSPSQAIDGIDLAELATALEKLRSAASDEGDTPELDMIKGAVAKAEVAARSGDRSGVAEALASLKPFGQTVLKIAEKVGVAVATAAIKDSLDL